MGIATRCGAKSVLLSTFEVAVFFAFTWFYFSIPASVYSTSWANRAAARNSARQEAMAQAKTKAIAAGESPDAVAAAAKAAAKKAGPPMRETKSLPIWMWLVLGIVYILIVTVWWVPGDEEANRKELIALTIVSSAMIVALAVIYRQHVGQIAETFYEIMKTGGRAA